MVSGVGTRVLNTLVGVARNGKTPVPNGKNAHNNGGGVYIFPRGGGCTMGGADDSSGSTNVVSGNYGIGIYVSGPGLRVWNTLVGVALDGVTPVPNGIIANTGGINVGAGAADCVIGAPGKGNVTVVSGNAGNGIDIHVPGARMLNTRVGLARDGVTPVPNSNAGVYVYTEAINCVIGMPGKDRVVMVGGNYGSGVYVSGRGMRMRNTLVGVALDGATPVPNGKALRTAGIYIADGATNCVIGAPDNGSLVVVSGNGGDGIDVHGVGVSVFNTLVGAGVTQSGTVAVPNFGDGIYLGETARNATIHGSVISGNLGSGISVYGRDATITGNIIGLDIQRNYSVSNHRNGINISHTVLSMVYIGSTDISTDKNTIAGNDLLAFSSPMPGMRQSNIIPARYSPTSPRGNGQELGVCRRCSCCVFNPSPNGSTHTGPTYQVDCRPLNMGGRTPDNACNISHPYNGHVPNDIGAPLGSNPLTLFPANTTVARLSGGRQLAVIEWGELYSTGPTLEVLDLSGNPQLNPMPPTGHFDRASFPLLASLRLAKTNLSHLRASSFQRMNRGTLVELDLSQPSQPGGAPLPTVSVNLTGFSNLGVVSWYNNICPKGFYAALGTPTRSDYTLCTRCPPGTYSSGPGGVHKGASCTPCKKGYFDLDNDPTTPCVVPPKPFTVIGFTRAAVATRRTSGAQLITDQYPRQTYTVGVPYEFAPVHVHCSGGAGSQHDLGSRALTFTKAETNVEGPTLANSTTTTSAFLIDPDSGMMQGTPSGAGVFNITLYVRNDVGEQALVQHIMLTAINPVPDPPPQQTVLYMALAAVCVLSLCVLSTAAVAWQERRLRDQAIDFKVILAQMQEDGLLQLNLQDLDRVQPLPRQDSLHGANIPMHDISHRHGSVSSNSSNTSNDRLMADTDSTKPGHFQQINPILSYPAPAPAKAGASGAGTHPNTHAVQPREVASQCLTMLGRLGSGAYGDVYSAMLNERTATRVPAYRVAVKVPLSNEESKREELFREAALMAQFVHPNIVALIGVVSRSQECKVIMQLCDKGSLRSLLLLDALSDGAQTLPHHTAVTIASDVAAGMAYLEARHFVHRDLAARNILVGADDRFLIADFGMARTLRGSEYYRVRDDVLLPLRWSAPEVVTKLRFSPASDVWSFFMMMFEVWSRGQCPFRDLGFRQVLALIEDLVQTTEQPLGFFGAALCAPAAADPLVFAELARMCLCTDPGDRATFAALHLWVDGHKGASCVAPALCNNGSGSDSIRAGLGNVDRVNSSKDSTSITSKISRGWGTSKDSTSAKSNNSTSGATSKDSTSDVSNSSTGGATSRNSTSGVSMGSTGGAPRRDSASTATATSSAASHGAGPSMASLLLNAYGDDTEKAMELLGAWGGSSNESDASFRSYERLDGGT